MDHPDSVKMVGYFGEIAHAASQRGLMLKDVYYRRAIPCYFD
jgi:hypothetical protein